MDVKILISAGGSGGHIFPAIALTQALRKKAKVQIIFVGSKRKLDRKLLEPHNFKKYFLSINPMPRNFGLKWIAFIGKFISDVIVSIGILISERPSICVGFGGYTQGAILLLARLFGVRIIVHEQNFIPGRANIIMDKMADKIAVSFKETESYFKNKRIVFTGNPIRDKKDNLQKNECLGLFGLDSNKTTLLVMGGSQGAKGLNRVAVGVLRNLAPEVTEKIQILHITGESDYDFVVGFYAKACYKASVHRFVEDIQHAYRVADAAFSRAGASSLSELGLNGIPMILIPYPGRKNNQRSNAAYLFEKKACVYIEEHDEEAIKKAQAALENLINDPAYANTLTMNAKKELVEDASDRLAEETINLLSK